MKKDLTPIKNLYISHRGLHNISKGIPENSILAFTESLKHLRDIELDIHLLKDGEIVVFHDDNIKRMTGVDKYLYDCTYDEIKNYKLLGSDETIPLLKDVLELVRGRVLLDIEFKYELPAGFLEAEACKLLDEYKGRFIVSSFNPFSIRWFKKNRPKYIRGLLVSDFKNEKMFFLKRIAMKNMMFNFLCKPDFIGYDIKIITESIANKIKSKKRPLFLWTVDSHEQFAKANELGDSFIYENIKV